MLFDRLTLLVASPRKERLILISISLVVLLIQLLTLRPPVGIGEPYWIARHLAAGQGFVYAYPFDTVFVPTCYIPPLYVWFHAAILQLGCGLIVSQIFGLLCFHFANYFFYRFFKRLTSPGIALIGFAIFACYVPLWLLAQKPDPDGLNLLLIALTVSVLDSVEKQPRLLVWLGLGILLGLQILVRPDILMGIVLFGIWMILFSKNSDDLKKKIIGYSFAVVVSLLIVLPWTIRNYEVFGSFVLVSANSGFNFYMGNNTVATGEFEQSPQTVESIAIDSARTNYFNSHQSPVDRDSYLFKVGKNWMLSHPTEAIGLAFKKFFFHWWQRNSAGFAVQASGWMMTCYKIISLFLLVFGFYGLFQLKSKATRALLLTLFIYSSAISVVFFTQSRHRAIKVDPFLVTLSVIGVSTMFEKVNKLAKRKS